MKHGIINGDVYEIRNTPRTYILDIFLYRIPLYFSLLITFSYVIVFVQKEFFTKRVFHNFNYNKLILF